VPSPIVRRRRRVEVVGVADEERSAQDVVDAGVAVTVAVVEEAPSLTCRLMKQAVGGRWCDGVRFSGW